jgi:hypothetical protein
MVVHDLVDVPGVAISGLIPLEAPLASAKPAVSRLFA